MRNIFIIARKELLSTFRQRNLLFIMFLSPIVLAAIMGLAFGGLGGSGAPTFADIRVAVVNQDTGFDLQAHLPAGVTNTQLADLQIAVGGETLDLGALLLQNPNLDLSTSDMLAGNLVLNFGDILASNLLAQPLTATGTMSGALSNPVGGLDINVLTCPLFPTDEQNENAFGGSLDDLFDAEMVGDAAAARRGVEQGDFAVAVIIPANFSNALAPDLGLGATDTVSTTGMVSATGVIEIIGNNGTPISASIVRAVVEGNVGNFVRLEVALSALAQTTINNLGALDLDAMAGAIQQVDASVLEPLGCLLVPGASNIQVMRQPLDVGQTHSAFSTLMMTLGASQAIFFALFTGVFGINSIYEDRRQGTLQRVLASPTPSSHVLLGRLVGNLLIVMCQLLILLTAFTLIASLIDGGLTLIWGANVPALLLVVAGLSLFTTGLGVLIVGLARLSEQVQLIGPLITLMLGALGGIFGPLVPSSFSRISPTWWGIEAMRKLGANEGDIGLNLLVLFGVGLLFALIGTFFFRRRMGL